MKENLNRQYPYTNWALKNPVTGLLFPPNKCQLKYVIDKLAQWPKRKTSINTWILIAWVAQWEADGLKMGCGNFQGITTLKQTSVCQMAIGAKTTDGCLELRCHSHRGVAVQADVQIILQSIHRVPRQPLQKHVV